MRLGRYEVVRELGKGAMGIVYLAKDPLIGRLVALKTIRPASHPDDDESREMLSCKFIAMAGMEITELSPELKACLRPILRK